MEASITSLCTHELSGPCDICHESLAWEILHVTPGWLERHADLLRQQGLGNLLLTEQQFYFSDGTPSFRRTYREDDGKITFTLCISDRERIVALGLVEKIYEADC